VLCRTLRRGLRRDRSAARRDHGVRRQFAVALERPQVALQLPRGGGVSSLTSAAKQRILALDAVSDDGAARADVSAREVVIHCSERVQREADVALGRLLRTRRSSIIRPSHMADFFWRTSRLTACRPPRRRRVTASDTRRKGGATHESPMRGRSVAPAHLRTPRAMKTHKRDRTHSIVGVVSGPALDHCLAHRTTPSCACREHAARRHRAGCFIVLGEGERLPEGVAPPLSATHAAAQAAPSAIERGPHFLGNSCISGPAWGPA
jgi:hypothetical protein